jgi:hypothetical protein
MPSMKYALLPWAWVLAAAAVGVYYWLTRRSSYELRWVRRTMYWQLTLGSGQVRIYRSRALRGEFAYPLGFSARVERLGCFYMKDRSPNDTMYVGCGNFCLARGKHGDRRYCVGSVPFWFLPLTLAASTLPML